jgi:hypothetical protein
MPDKLVNMKQAAIRDGMVLLVMEDEDGAVQTMYLQPQYMAPGDGIVYPRKPGAEPMRPRRRVNGSS